VLVSFAPHPANPAQTTSAKITEVILDFFPIFLIPL
jgi:hypothetical protein